MNGRITIAVVIPFAFVFFFLFLLDDVSSSVSNNRGEHEFFLKEFDPEEKKIFILGSSHIGTLNTTLVNDVVNKHDSRYTVYHLGYNGDKPEIREELLPQIISLEPDIIFYGISYRDFGFFAKSTEAKVLDIRELWEKSIDELYEDGLINPQLMTRKSIRNLLIDTGISEATSYDIVPKNTVFSRLSGLQTKIVSGDELQRQVLTAPNSPLDLTLEYEDNEQVLAFKRIIDKFQKNNVKVVIFITPLPAPYLENLTDSTKSIFDKIVEDVSNEYLLDVYDFKDKYADMKVWHNLDHIAYNEKSMGFSQDLAKIIIFEIEV